MLERNSWELKAREAHQAGENPGGLYGVWEILGQGWKGPWSQELGRKGRQGCRKPGRLAGGSGSLQLYGLLVVWSQHASEPLCLLPQQQDGVITGPTWASGMGVR